ncbi:sensor histidine kinase, partial [Intrasporangium sp.]|uniref:sensor histidine kinase n=1 Tax=Intrasporangium sp. TaxID=1925024 RepID=UPI00293BA14E
DGRWTDRRRPVGFLAGPVHGRTWRELGFIVLVLPLAPFALAYGLLVIVSTAILSITVWGLVVPGTLVQGARGWGSMYRGLARALLAIDVAEPAPLNVRQGFWAGLRARITDVAGWRAVTFLVVSFPVAIVGFVVVVTHLGVSLGLMTNWIWGRYLPETVLSDGTRARGINFGPDWVADTPTRQALVAALGLALFFVLPPVVRAFAHLGRMLVVGLLAPTSASLRVASLERSRSHTVEDSAERLRRIERDLHDGAQARLVAIAMQLGEAVDLLGPDGRIRQDEPSASASSAAAALVTSAHLSTKEALVELRELARGIHPPALDNGLAVALETLAARSPLDVEARVEPLADPSPAVEAIIYFCAAELLTNAVKHADASRVVVTVDETDGHLRLRVQDDGRGGAAIHAPDSSGNGSGLAGLAERVAAVDGHLDVRSPVGGPTVVTVVLPARV